MYQPLTAALGALLWVTASPAQVPAGMPSEEIDRILQERVDTDRQATGMVVGVIEHGRRRIVAHGTFGTVNVRPVDGDTIFEIGSVNKVFTSLLLADAVQRGLVALDDPVAQYLPDEVEVPDRPGTEITFLDLATQTSGLPRLPANMAPANPRDPYADYAAADLYAFLSDYELPRDIGATFEYSNLGYGLLGHVLALAAGSDYEALLQERVLEPLGLDDTAITLSSEQRARMAVGHDRFLRSAPNWNWQVLAGAGALNSTANDLLDFLAAAMGLETTPLAPAFAATLEPQRAADREGVEVGLGWLLQTAGDDMIAWHNGITGGYHAFIGFRRDAQVGVVVLSNAGTAVGGDDIGLHLLDATVPLASLPPAQVAVELPAAALDAYVGTYQLTPDFAITVTREDHRLVAQASGQAAAEIVPVGGHRFVHSQVEAEIEFDVDGTGSATGLVLRQGGAETAGERVE